MFKVFEVDAIQTMSELLAKIMSVYPRGGTEPQAMSFCSTCSLRVNNENVMVGILGYDIDFMRKLVLALRWGRDAYKTCVRMHACSARMRALHNRHEKFI